MKAAELMGCAVGLAICGGLAGGQLREPLRAGMACVGERLGYQLSGRNGAGCRLGRAGTVAAEAQTVQVSNEPPADAARIAAAPALFQPGAFAPTPAAREETGVGAEPAVSPKLSLLGFTSAGAASKGASGAAKMTQQLLTRVAAQPVATAPASSGWFSRVAAKVFSLGRWLGVGVLLWSTKAEAPGVSPVPSREHVGGTPTDYMVVVMREGNLLIPYFRSRDGLFARSVVLNDGRHVHASEDGMLRVDNKDAGAARSGQLAELLKAQCFVAGTLVHTVEGMRAIETLQVGDVVWARDEVSGELAAKPVLRIFARTDRPVVRMTISGAAGPEIIGVTPEHPFFVTERGWVGAGNLRSADELQTLEGTQVRVVAVEDHRERETVHNLEVADAHTYFVGRGAAWVHNECEPVRLPHLSAAPPGGLGEASIETIGEAFSLAEKNGNLAVVAEVLRAKGVLTDPIDLSGPTVRKGLVLTAAPHSLGQAIHEWRAETVGGRVVLIPKNTDEALGLRPEDVVVTPDELLWGLNRSSAELVSKMAQRWVWLSGPPSPSDLVFWLRDKQAPSYAIDWFMGQRFWRPGDAPLVAPLLARNFLRMAAIADDMGARLDGIVLGPGERVASTTANGRAIVTLGTDAGPDLLKVSFRSDGMDPARQLRDAASAYRDAARRSVVQILQQHDPTIRPTPGWGPSRVPNGGASDVMAALQYMGPVQEVLSNGSSAWISEGLGVVVEVSQVDSVRDPMDEAARRRGLAQYFQQNAASLAMVVPQSVNFASGVITVEVPAGSRSYSDLSLEDQRRLIDAPSFSRDSAARRRFVDAWRALIEAERAQGMRRRDAEVPDPRVFHWSTDGAALRPVAVPFPGRMFTAPLRPPLPVAPPPTDRRTLH